MTQENDPDTDEKLGQDETDAESENDPDTDEKLGQDETDAESDEDDTQEDDDEAPISSEDEAGP